MESLIKGIEIEAKDIYKTSTTGGVIDRSYVQIKDIQSISVFLSGSKINISLKDFEKAILDILNK